MKPSDNTNAPEQIEITPEMIEAGLEAFCSHDDRFHSEEETVALIYLAMITQAGLLNVHPKLPHGIKEDVSICVAGAACGRGTATSRRNLRDQLRNVLFVKG